MSDQRSLQEDKHKINRTSSKFRESSRSMQSDDYFARKLKALNGSMGPPVPSNASSKSESNQSNGTPAVPKMGVRARVSEWPPKKDCSKELSKAAWENRPPASYESVGSVHPNGQNDQNEGQQEELELEFAEGKYSIGDLFVHSPQRGLHPIRQRSNSDVTISDIDAEDVLDQNAVNPNTGAALHREYGSTSSIDRQGLSGENFFAMLRGYRVENFEHKTLAPFGFPEFFHCDPSVSPSLHAAAQISRGEFVRISGLDYMDSALLIGREREKSFKRRLKAETVETSLFRKLRTVKSEHETFKFSTDLDDRLDRNVRSWNCQKCFAHYDVQSILFNINEAMATRVNVGKRKNITTGASAASQTQMPAGQTGNCESPLGSKEDLNSKENLDADEGDGKSNDLVLSCPYFRNETGGEGDRRIALSRANSASFSSGESCSFESSLSSHCTNAGVSVLEVPRENQSIHREKVKRYIIEHIDLGAYYYRKFFYGKEHQNYFGIDENLGPVAVSIRREKVEDAKEKEGSQFNYRIVFRTSELTTLRGAILEDAIPSTARHGTARGLPLKEVLEYVIPELSIQCLRQASNSPKVPEQLLKLDEQGLSFQHKIGILYCKAGQSTEEEMYNNEMAGPAFEEFLDLLGQRVRLKGFSKYRAQLDNKTDSTGTHSLYTTYKDYELMFHVSTMLPYMPSNRQQLLRKRHIGNDIVTIVFQEPGALPFTPKNIRSHFQHVFVIVKVHNPCTENVCYSVGVSRSKDVPPFGPPIPKGVTFPKSAVFRDFLLAKVINAENAAHKSEKFRAMATRTRQEYLKDLAENFVTTATVDTSAKFSFITLGAKKKEKVKPRKDAHLFSVGAIMWNVIARDFGQSADIECLLGISNEFIMLIEKESKNVVFNCSCRDVIGWTSGLMSIKIFYERGECILLSAADNCAEDIREIVQRLEIVTRGCETTEMTLRRNGLGQLGFHVNFEGIVADVEPFGFAWKAGLRQGSRLVEICKVAVATLTHEQMIDLLRTSVTVKVVIIQPHEDGAPRRSSPSNQSSSSDPGPSGSSQWRQQVGYDGCQSPLLHEHQGSGSLEIEGGRERDETLEGTRHSETKWHAPSTKILSSYKDRALQKDGSGKESPNKLSHIGDKSCSSHSSSNTLSSNTSSNSDEKHFGSGDLMDPELLGLTYIKGASTDSGIDTAPCMSAPLLAPLHLAGSRSGVHCRTEQWTESSETAGLDEDPAKMYAVHSYASAISASHTAEGSMGDLSEISSHSSGSHHSGSPSTHCSKKSGSLDTSKVYIVSQNSSQQISGSVSKPYHRQGAVSKYVIGWKKSEGSPTPEESEISECHEVYDDIDAVSASSPLQTAVRNAIVESQQVLSKEDFLKLMLPENISVEEGRRKFSFYGNLSPRRTLYRTLSDESICSNRRGSSYASSRSSVLDQALPNDILFSTTPPYHSTLPPRMSLTPGMGNLRSFDSDEELGPFCHHTPFLDQRVASFCTLDDMQHAQGLEGTQELPLDESPTDGKDFLDAAGEHAPTTLTGKVNQLEVILRQLQTDLRKEKQDKAVLQAEVQHLRQDNMRLQEESQTAAAQLRKFTEWFFNTIDKKS
uniref:Signal induced proliferation associated 1 like 2 n=1 Tax=Meleagris gallopavo TaxID=9103 RepID=A0A803YD57_MELGA